MKAGQWIPHTSLAGLVTLTLGCASPAEPVEAVAAPLSGMYVLATISGQPLPFTYTLPATFFAGSREIQVLGDTLQFRADGTGTMSGASNSRDIASNVVTPQVYRFTFRHTRAGSGVVVELDKIDCGPGCTSSTSSASYTVQGDALVSLGFAGRGRHERRSP